MVPQLLQGKALNPNVAFEALHGLVPIAPSSLASLYAPGDPASAVWLLRPTFILFCLGLLADAIRPVSPTSVSLPVQVHLFPPEPPQQPLQLLPPTSLAPSSPFATWHPETWSLIFLTDSHCTCSKTQSLFWFLQDLNDLAYLSTSLPTPHKTLPLFTTPSCTTIVTVPQKFHHVFYLKIFVSAILLA